MKLFFPAAGFLALRLVIPLAHAAPPAPGSEIPLWPEGVPGAPRADVLQGRPTLGAEVHAPAGHIGNISNPTLTYFPPAVDRPNGTAVVICPGGGYVLLSTEREGVQYAHWLSTLGVASFVLKNRLGEYGHPAPLQDVLRAIRIVRSRAAEFHVDPNRVGAMGSSAGGHLAASAGTLFDSPMGKTGTGLDAVSARPDFLILLYPVITFESPAMHRGSRDALLGKNPTPELVHLLSLENQVTSATPPTLLIHTEDDQTVPVENSILFYQALTRARVPSELLVFPHGEHGMGMRADLGVASGWPRLAEEWLRDRGLLEPSAVISGTKKP